MVRGTVGPSLLIPRASVARIKARSARATAVAQETFTPDPDEIRLPRDGESELSAVAKPRATGT